MLLRCRTKQGVCRPPPQQTERFRARSKRARFGVRLPVSCSFLMVGGGQGASQSSK